MQCIETFEGFIELRIGSWDNAVILGIEQRLDELMEKINVKVVGLMNEGLLERFRMVLVFVRQWKCIARSMAFQGEQDGVRPLVKLTRIDLNCFLWKRDPEVRPLREPIDRGWISGRWPFKG